MKKLPVLSFLISCGLSCLPIEQTVSQQITPPTETFSQSVSERTLPETKDAPKPAVGQRDERPIRQETAPKVNLRKIRYSIDVAPLLRRHCTRCHGEKKQEADLRLDLLDAASRQNTDSETESFLHGFIQPGEADDSLLIQRISNPEKGDLMPLDSDPLTEQEVAVLERWINEGAIIDRVSSTSGHWSYQPLRTPEVPAASDGSSPIDRYIASELERQGLSFSKIEAPGRLLRRVSLALTGLPPSLADMEFFTEAPTLTSYEKLVDQYLDSPRYGERWAVHWLDLARYADSNGFQADQIRDNWAYRDWVIRSFNNSMPYDQFIKDQIAGDLVQNPTVDQRIATGFHRMTTCNVEAGVDPEANRVNQVVDRVNTTATVFLGTTMECAQCHDHKYDPFTQQEYYQLFAYFNNTSLEVENTSDVTWDFNGPFMELPLSIEKSKLRDELTKQLRTQRQSQEAYSEASESAYQEWVETLVANENQQWVPTKPKRFTTTGSEKFDIQDNGAVLISGPVPDKVEYIFEFESPTQAITGIRVDALTDETIPGSGPGRGDAERTNIILSEIECDILRQNNRQSVKLTDAIADFSQANWDVSNAIDGNPKTGWAIGPQFGKPHWASFTFKEAVDLKPGEETLSVSLKQYFGSGRVIGKPRISFYHGDPSVLGIEKDLLSIAAKAKRTTKEEKRLREAFDQRDPIMVAEKTKIDDLQKQIAKLKPDTTLVMQEDSPRETFVMLRGDHESTGEKVVAGIPGAIRVGESTVGGNRLTLAKWLVSEENPLTARVVVNQWWSEIFGRGLVSTPEDFGSQGERPTHPELLDWLASELRSSGWSMKHLHKIMVMSHAFRQSSSFDKARQTRDPNNIWLSRSPRLRMKAEFIRDNGLAISGLLSSKQSGPPIMPYQPDNLWRSVGRNQPKWVAAIGEDRFRRGVYVIWKRAAPYPSFVNFDAPSRGACTVQRSRSNTPLQALTLLNDPAYLEMALGFADRILCEAPSTDDATRLVFGFKLAVSRQPTKKELQILSRLLDKERSKIKLQPDLIDQRMAAPAKVVPLRSEDREELASWLSVANALLNLDETMSR